MAGEYDFENLPVNVRRTEAGDSYQVGVVIHGKWFPFAGFVGPGFEADVQEALDAEQEAKSQADQAAAEEAQRAWIAEQEARRTTELPPPPPQQ